jgi:tetratricopeptide (TPR) repeat protein
MASSNESARLPGEGTSPPEARLACERRDWTAALDLLIEEDVEGGLDPGGLELLADCARWAGRGELLVSPLERAHRGFVECGDLHGAARTALGLCNAYADVCNRDLAGAWWKRASDLLEGLEESSIHGLHAWFLSRRLAERGDQEGQEREARRALEIARRHGDKNVEALALIEVAHVATVRGHTTAVSEALERATSFAVSGEIGLMESGMVFCSAIWASRSRGDWTRAQQWTDSANRWVDRTQVSYFPGLCQVHRSEVRRIRGELAEAEHEALEATRMLESSIPRWTCLAWAELGEVRRRRGDAEGAMVAFRHALELGWDPQPGLALQTLAMGDARSAFLAIERVFRQPSATLLCEDRVNLLQARVTIAVAEEEWEAAEEAVAELERLAAAEPTPWDAAAHAHSRGELRLARGECKEAIADLMHAKNAWAELGAPYEMARCRILLAAAFEADGDPVAAELETTAASEGLQGIGATLIEPERASAAGTGPDDTARLVREGDYWSFHYGDRVVRLKDSRGVGYLATLLIEPDVDHFAVVLAAGPREDGGAALRGDAGEVLDDQALGEYRRRTTRIETELEEARELGDEARQEALGLELEAIGAQLASAVGLGGRSRRTGSPVERARQSVTKALRRVQLRIAEEHPRLGRHLEASLRTGTSCVFRTDPDRPVRWLVNC